MWIRSLRSEARSPFKATRDSAKPGERPGDLMAFPAALPIAKAILLPEVYRLWSVMHARL